jgi:deazaflavin-dependent oxidoreductase (nitroreductase family)
MKGNDFVSLLLRSPLHKVMGPTMLITVIGRKTGRPITTPVNYVRSGDELWILSKRSRTWWRNVRTAAQVRLHLRGQEMRGDAEVILDNPAVTARLVEYVRAMPAAARSLGIKMVDGTPDPSDIAREAQDRLFVKVCLEDSAGASSIPAG